MIVGISGKKGAGKDEVGKIIQYLTHCQNDSTSWEDWCTLSHPFKGCNWKVKKYADKLKDMVCLLIGCTREQLEDREFKEKELGEEWDIKHGNWVTEKTIKSDSDIHNLTIDEYLTKFKNDYEEVDFNSNKRYFRYKGYDKKLTPRKLMQLLGTEAGRQIIHPNIWVNSLFSDYKDIVHNGGVTETEYNFGKPYWVITDVRFPNELEAIKQRDGINIRINRNLKYKFDNSQNIHLLYDSDDMRGTVHTFKAKFYPNEDSCREYILKEQHISETALDNADFDYIIDNDGSIEELIEKVKAILIKENLL